MFEELYDQESTSITSPSGEYLVCVLYWYFEYEKKMWYKNSKQILFVVSILTR